MKREELEKLGLTKEQIDTVMAANGADIETAKKDAAKLTEQVGTLTTERDSLQEQIKARDKDIATMKKAVGENETLSKQFTELQAKYDGDTKTLNEKLEKQRYDFAAEQVFATIPFASRLARRAAVDEFKSKGYKLTEDGKFAEASGYIDTLKKEEPAAFLSEQKEEPGNGAGAGEQKLPAFSKPNTGNSGTASGPAFFSGGGLNFVRTPPAEKK